MNQLRTATWARFGARFMVLCLLGSLAWRPSPASAALRGQAVAVFVEQDGGSEELTPQQQASRQLLSGVSLALAEADHLKPLDADRVHKAAQDLGLISPLEPSDLARLGKAVEAVWAVGGEVLRVAVEEEKHQATVEVDLLMVEVAGGQVVSRSRVRARSEQRPGYQGLPEEWVRDATDLAAMSAVHELLANRYQKVGFVLSVREEGLTVSLNSRQGVRRGSELAIVRNGQTIATARVTEALPTHVTATLLDTQPGVRVKFQDEARVLYTPSPTLQEPEPHKSKKDKASKDWGWIALLALGAILLANRGGDNGGHGGPPQGVTLIPGNEEVQLFWQESEGKDVVGYRIFRSELPDRGFTLIASPSVTTTSYVDANLRNGKTYYYRLATVDSKQRESKRTEVFSATPQGEVGGGGPATAPSFPEGLDVQAQFDRLVLVWNANPELDLKEYRIYRAIDDVNVPTSAEGAQPYGVVSHPLTTFTDLEVTADHIYYYRITAVNQADLESLPSVPAQGRPGQPKVQLVAPGENQAFQPENEIDLEKGEEFRIITVQFGWNPVANASRYLFELAEDEEITNLKPGGQAFVEASSTPSFIYTLTIGPIVPIGSPIGTQQLYWRVTAVNDENVVLDQSQVRPVTFDWDG